MCCNCLSRRALLAFALASVTAPLAGCDYNDDLGRRQLVLVGEAELAQMAEGAWRETLRRGQVSSDPAANRRVGRTGARIAEAAGRADQRWEYAVLDDPAPNAFVLPGNRVAVNTGLLAIAPTDGQLAAVLGHEVAHVTAQHAAERFSQSSLAQVGVAAASAAIGESDPQTAQQVAGVLGIGVEFGVLNPFSRRHELEADRIGLDYMNAAGYRPSEALEFWRAMSTAGGAQPPAILSTHPANAERIAGIQEHIVARGYA